MHAALLVLALAASPNPAHWSFDTGPNPQVEVSNISGPITVVAAPGNQAVVDAEWRGGSEAEHGKWTVEVTGGAGHVNARVCCGPCRDQGSCNGDAKLAFTLRVPAGSAVTVHQVSGLVNVDNTTGPVEVKTVSGRIHLGGLADRVKLNTVSGDAEISLVKPAPVELHSVSGSFKVKLAAGSGAQVRLSTVSGELNGEHVGIGSLSRTVGSGGPEIVAKTVSGSIDVQP